MGWLQRRRDATLDKLVAFVDTHVPGDNGVCSGKACRHSFDGTAEGLRRHQLEVAYRRGRSSGGG